MANFWDQVTVTT